MTSPRVCRAGIVAAGRAGSGACRRLGHRGGGQARQWRELATAEPDGHPRRQRGGAERTGAALRSAGVRTSQGVGWRCGRPGRRTFPLGSAVCAAGDGCRSRVWSYGPPIIGSRCDRPGRTPLPRSWDRRRGRTAWSTGVVDRVERRGRPAARAIDLERAPLLGRPSGALPGACLRRGACRRLPWVPAGPARVRRPLHV